MDTGVAEWPAVPWNAWSHCNQCSTVWGSQNETLWTLIQRCESMKLAQWPATPALPIFFALPSASLSALSAVSCFWQSFKCLLKELWQPWRENWNMFLGSLFLDVKKPRKKPWKTRLNSRWDESEKADTDISEQISYWFKFKYLSLHSLFLDVFYFILILSVAHSYPLNFIQLVHFALDIGIVSQDPYLYSRI